MSTPNTGGPAFPLAYQHERVGGGIITCQQDGMSLRAYIATAALQGIVTATAMITDQVYSPQDRAREAVLYADALIAELNK